MNLISTAIETLVKEAPELAIKYGPKLLQMGPEAVSYVKDILKINNLKTKIKKISKDSEEYYLKIGREMCNNKKPNDSFIKTNIEKVNANTLEIEKIKEELQEYENRIKGNKVISDLSKELDEVRKEKEKKRAKNKTKKNTKSKKKNK